MTALERHLKWLRQQACVASGQRPVTLHHVLGGSVLERLGVRGTRKHSDWLQLPLHHDYHQGRVGIHTIGVETWEGRYGRQADFIDALGRRAGVDLWALARQEGDDRRARRRRPRSTKLLPHPGVVV